MYKMICLDLDSTVLNDCKKISKENINLIIRAYLAIQMLIIFFDINIQNITKMEEISQR